MRARRALAARKLREIRALSSSVTLILVTFGIGSAFSFDITTPLFVLEGKGQDSKRKNVAQKLNPSMVGLGENSGKEAYRKRKERVIFWRIVWFLFNLFPSY